MDEEIAKLVVDLINKLDEKFENRFNKLDSDTKELKKIIEEKLNLDFIENLHKEIKKLNENMDYIKENIKSLDTSKLEKINDLIEKMKDMENKLMNVLEKLEKLEDNMPVMFYHIKDLTEYEDKLEELISKIDKWDKIFDIEEIEYYPERVELIKKWVEDQLKKGYSLDEIREELIKNGYSSFFINKVLKDFEKKF